MAQQELPLPPIPHDLSPLPTSDSQEHQSPPTAIHSGSSLPSLEPIVSPYQSGNITPLSPISPGRESKPPKRPNPLIDLIETESTYVDLLRGIIRKVAAAWSRTNLPPAQLDAVFRAVELIYKANRALLDKLNEIGPKPSSPKALGDLLMRWIDDLDVPYTRYAQVYTSSFDEWDPIRSNTRLPGVLSSFSLENPPISADSTNVEQLWTLDSLLALPRVRLKYYKRLYGRLLKSTSPGRSDYELLHGANEKLEALMALLDSRAKAKVGSQEQLVSNEEQSQEVSRLSTQSSSQASSITSVERLSRETAHTSLGPILMPSALEIERSVSTSRTIDIFTMRPRQVKLSLNPPDLPFVRQLRISCDVIIHFTPRADGLERIHEKGHIFLMTDLFLVCERLSEEDDKQQILRDASRTGEENSPEWSLCYPPLAARHLTVTETSGLIVHIQIMKKESLYLHLPNLSTKNHLLQEFEAALQMANSLSHPAKAPVNGLPPSPAALKPGSNASLPAGAVLPSQAKIPMTYSQSIDSDMLVSASLGPQPGQFLSREFSLAASNGRDLGHIRAQASPPPSEPVVQQGLPRIIQPQPMPLPSDIPTMLEPHPTGPAFTPNPMSVNHYPGSPVVFENMPPRLYSAPPPVEGSGFVPPPRGASRTSHDTMVPKISFLDRKTSSAPASDGGQDTRLHVQQGFTVYGIEHDLSGYQRPDSRASTDPSPHARLKKQPSRTLTMQHQEHHSLPPPIPSREPSIISQLSRASSATVPVLPSAALRSSQAYPSRSPSYREISPPTSPIEGGEPAPGSLTSTTVAAQMKCKVFLKQHHAQWKSLGGAKLKLYLQHPTNVKQLVVEADTKEHSILISTIILTDGVERVGKTGVAIELSNRGTRTGIVYMIQLRNEAAASGLFDQLLMGSDRTATTQRQGFP